MRGWYLFHALIRACDSFSLFGPVPEYESVFEVLSALDQPGLKLRFRFTPHLAPSMLGSLVVIHDGEL